MTWYIVGLSLTYKEVQIKMLTLPKGQALLAEFLGTAILVMMALVLTQTTRVSYFVGTSVALTLGAVYMMFSRVSQAHVNPAITLAMWSVRRIATVPAVAYIAAQLVGGFVSWKLYEYFTAHHLTSLSSKWDWRVFVAEAVGTMILAMGFGAAVSKGLSQLEAAFTYGFSLFVGIMVAATASAAYLNPAVALGVRSFNWTYVLGPVIGGLVGLNIYSYMFGGAKLPMLKMNVKPAKK